MTKLYSCLAALMLAQISFGQISLLSTDEPIAGDSASYFLMDSLAPNLALVTGSNVTWDYSSIEAYGSAGRKEGYTKALSSSLYSGFFSGATLEQYIEGHVHDFYNFNTAEKKSYGMQITEQNNGDFLITHDARQVRTYPWTLNSHLSGNLSNGKLIIEPNGANQTAFNAQGTYDIICDGYGTLQVGDSIVPNVLRNHIFDSVNAVILIANAKLVLHQYEYYIKDNPFPIFIHAFVHVYGATLNVNYTLVLSQVPPHKYTGIRNEQPLALFAMYPNPAENLLNINFNDYVERAEIRIYDVVGKVQKSSQLTQVSGLSTMDIQDLKAGNYLVEILTAEGRSVQKLVVNR